jgi:hypothetical protein
MRARDPPKALAIRCRLPSAPGLARPRRAVRRAGFAAPLDARTPATPADLVSAYLATAPG